MRESRHGRIHREARKIVDDAAEGQWVDHDEPDGEDSGLTRPIAPLVAVLVGVTAIATLGLFGVICWAIIRLVLWAVS